MDKQEQRYKKYQHKVTIEKVKNELKKKYISNIKNARETNLDRRRNLISSQISLDIIRNEIRDGLLKDNYEPDDIERILNEVQEENVLHELNAFANEYITMEDSLINDSVRTHLNQCTFCEQYIQSDLVDTAIICDKCADINFNDAKCDS